MTIGGCWLLLTLTSYGPCRSWNHSNGPSVWLNFFLQQNSRFRYIYCFLARYCLCFARCCFFFSIYFDPLRNLYSEQSAQDWSFLAHTKVPTRSPLGPPLPVPTPKIQPPPSPHPTEKISLHMTLSLAGLLQWTCTSSAPPLLQKALQGKPKLKIRLVLFRQGLSLFRQVWFLFRQVWSIIRQVWYLFRHFDFHVIQYTSYCTHI